MEGGHDQGQRCGAKGQRQRRADRPGPGMGLRFPFPPSMTQAPGQRCGKLCSRAQVPAGTRDRTGRPGPAQPPPRSRGDKGLGLPDLPQTHHFRIPRALTVVLSGETTRSDRQNFLRNSGRARNTWTGTKVEKRRASGAGGSQRRGLRKPESPPRSVCVSDWTLVVT